MLLRLERTAIERVHAIDKQGDCATAPWEISSPMTAVGEGTRLVELFGVPGAGKTTLSRLAALEIDAVSRHELSALWKKQSVFRTAGGLARAFLNFDRLLLALRFAGEARLWNRESLWRLLRLLTKSQAMRSKCDRVLLDQGLLQELWSALAAAGRHEVPSSVLVSLIRSLYDGIDARILYVEIGVEGALQRIAARRDGHSRLDGLWRDELRNELVRSTELARRIIDSAISAGLPVEVIDSTQPAEIAASAVVSAFDRSRVASN
jgi:hypothetical protein